MTVTPTGLRTHEPPNVVPPFADVICDCRTLPGQTVDDIADHVARRSARLRLRPRAARAARRRDRVAHRHAALRRAGGVRRRPRSRGELLPLLSAGFTDSHWIRAGFGTVAYGFAPVLFGDVDAYLNAAHGADEAIEIADLVEMAEFHLGLLTPPGRIRIQPDFAHKRTQIRANLA